MVKAGLTATRLNPSFTVQDLAGRPGPPTIGKVEFRAFSNLHRPSFRHNLGLTPFPCVPQPEDSTTPQTGAE
jgi:hypothetical protein